MQIIKISSWFEPKDIAGNISTHEENWALFHSGMQTRYTGRYSYLALHASEIVDTPSTLSKKLTSDKQTHSNAWFGYLGYGLKNQFEQLRNDKAYAISHSDMVFCRYDTIITFDHIKRNIIIWTENKKKAMEFWQRAIISSPLVESDFSVVNLSSNMSRDEYLKKVSYIKQLIKDGTLYQANLTRKFFGELIGEYTPFSIFNKLTQISPTPYSAFIKNGSTYVISSSPERFMHIDSHGNVNMRPIKGSTARYKDINDDLASKTALASSVKDKAENLMIVDLSRNDLSRNCLIGSIKVDQLYEIESYTNIHHMVSSINGIKNPNTTTWQLVQGCFPPGSMTGTPKIKAMDICSHLEQLKRGIYSGAIGWFGGDGSADLSVVIRTIILQNNMFEFQVGGAIVHDSTPENEFDETIIKAKNIAKTLNIPLEKLCKL